MTLVPQVVQTIPGEVPDLYKVVLAQEVQSLASQAVQLVAQAVQAVPLA